MQFSHNKQINGKKFSKQFFLITYEFARGVFLKFNTSRDHHDHIKHYAKLITVNLEGRFQSLELRCDSHFAFTQFGPVKM